MCSICGIHLESSQQSIGVCDEPFCREQSVVNRAEHLAQHLREKRARLEALALANWHDAQPAASTTTLTPSGPIQSNHPITSSTPIPIVVPANRRQLSSPSAERVAVLRDNLTALANIAVAEASGQQQSNQNALSERLDRESAEALEAEQADTNYDTLVGHACSTCLGFCCFAGRNHAFLKLSDMRRTMHDKQLLDAESLVDYFLSYLPEQSVQDSCLFHGPQGCGMPRRMRSDMCNTTLCPSLVNLYHKSAGQSPTQHYLFAATNVEDDLQPEPQVFQIKVARLS